MNDKELGELLDLTRENNKILRGMQRSARVAKFFRLVYWALIIGSLVGSYYYVQPYVDKLIGIYDALGGGGALQQLDSVLKNK